MPWHLPLGCGALALTTWLRCLGTYHFAAVPLACMRGVEVRVLDSTAPDTDLASG